MIRIILSSSLAFVAVGGMILSIGHSLSEGQSLSGFHIVWGISVALLAFVEITQAIRETMRERLRTESGVGSTAPRINNDTRLYPAVLTGQRDDIRNIKIAKQKKTAAEATDEIDSGHESENAFETPVDANIEIQAKYFYGGVAVAACACMGLMWALWQHFDILRAFSFAGLSVGLATSTLALASAEQKVETFSAEDAP